MGRILLILLLTIITLAAGAAPQPEPLWIEVEAYREAQGTVQLLDETASDYGTMAKADASGERFVRFGAGVALTLPPVTLPAAGEWSVWVRAFPLPGRRATVLLDGKEAGSTPGNSETIALTWQCVGRVRLGAGDHSLTVRAADGNTALAYVDVVALLADPEATPMGRSPRDIVTGKKVARIVETFSAKDVNALAEGWQIKAPPGADALIEMAPGEDDGALHVHNGAGESFTLSGRQPLDVKPGDQLSVRLRVRKGTLVESLSVVVAGVGSFSPQLYRQFRTVERTWLVPATLSGPVVVQVIGRGGGDTYLSHLEVFRPDPPVSSFETGRFLPAPTMDREGRLFEIERYVVNSDAFSGEKDADGDGLWSLCRLSREENAPYYFSRGTVLKSDSVPADRPAPADGCRPLHVRVGPLEPGRYQVHLSVPGRALAYSPDGKEWTRLPGRQRPDLGLVTLKEPFFEFWLDDRYAESGNPGPAYVDFIRFLPIEDPAYTMAPAPAPTPPARGSVSRRRVPLFVENPGGAARTGEVVRSGVPVPKGELADAGHARLLDAAGRELPACFQATGRWPDGSVKWLLLDFPATVAPGAAAKMALEYGTQVRAKAPAEALRVGRQGAITTVDAGSLRVSFDAAAGGRFSVFRPGVSEPVLALAEMEFRAADGRVWRASGDAETQVEVEERNALRATVRLRGRCGEKGGPSPLGFDVRVHLFASPRLEMLLEPAFFATEAEATLALKEVTLRFRGPWAGSTARFGLQAGESAPVPAAQSPSLLQSGTEAYGSKGAFPFALRDGTGKSLATGERAGGWLSLAGGGSAALFCMPYFWQQFAKGLACDSEGVTISLWPAGEGIEPFVMHAGAGKSHRLGISLGAGASPERWLAPLFARADPEWYCASGAFEEMVARRPARHAAYEAAVDAGFETLLRDTAGYGMENWGDSWQGGYVPGAKTWSNQEWDLVNNWLIPFARTGQRRFLDYAHEAARHFADVDCIHYARNPALLGGAWMHAHTSLRGHQLEPPNFAHAGWVEGLLNLYHLTGDRRGLEAAQGIGGYICRHAPQVERLPPGGPPYGLSIQRPAGWPLTTLCLLYRETGDPVTLQTARRIVDYARRCQDPERGLWDAQTGHEAPYRGGCVFAYTLFRGLRLFADLTGDDRARADYVSAARWIFGEMWRPGHRYLYEQVPLHEPGALVPFTLSEMGGYATRLSRDPIYAAIAFDALREHSAEGPKSWMVGGAARVQWGNGILQQVPRMLWDWERTGLQIEPRVTLAGPASATKVPLERAGRLSLLLRNESDAPLEGLSASCLIRGDWRAEVISCPARLGAHASATVEVACTAPVPLARYELQSDLAHLHVLVRGRQGKRNLAAWGWARLEIAGLLEVAGPASVALKAGAATEVALSVTDGVDARPQVVADVKADVPGLVVGPARVAVVGEGRVRVVVPLSVPAGAEAAKGVLTVALRSGPRRVAFEVPVEVGRFRVVLIENEVGDEWRYPLAALHAYPGIAAEFLPAGSLATAFPDTPEGIAGRWDAVALGDTGTGAAAFTPKQLAALAEFVRRGGGLMTIGGAKCYTAGGYANAPLAGVLPVDLSDGSYAMGEIGVDVLEKAAVFFEGYDPVFPRFGAHQRLREKAGTRVLARFSDGTPFAVLGTAGRGRVLSLGAIWNHGSGKAFREWPAYGRFIGRCVRWIARDLE